MRSNGFSSEDIDWSEMFATGVVELIKEGKSEEVRQVVRSVISKVTEAKSE